MDQVIEFEVNKSVSNQYIVFLNSKLLCHIHFTEVSKFIELLAKDIDVKWAV